MSGDQPVVVRVVFFCFFNLSVCFSYAACSAASLFRLLQPLRLHLIPGLFSRFIIPASSAAQFAPRIRLVQPLHCPGFFSRSVCISCPVCSAASSRLLQPLNLLLVSGLFSRFIIPASSAAPSATILFAIILIVAINTSSQTPQLCEHRAKHLNSAMPKPLYL